MVTGVEITVAGTEIDLDSFECSTTVSVTEVLGNNADVEGEFDSVAEDKNIL